MASGLTGLVSNVLGLRGRHMVVDAACASSLAALEIGVRALRRGKLSSPSSAAPGLTRRSSR